MSKKEYFRTPGGGGGGGGTLIFSNIRSPGYVGSRNFFGFKILNFNILGFFRKMNIFEGMKILWVITKLDYLGVICMHFRVFSKGQGTELGIFLGDGKISIFFGGT